MVWSEANRSSNCSLTTSHQVSLLSQQRYPFQIEKKVRYTGSFSVFSSNTLGKCLVLEYGTIYWHFYIILLAHIQYAPALRPGWKWHSWREAKSLAFKIHCIWNTWWFFSNSSTTWETYTIQCFDWGFVYYIMFQDNTLKQNYSKLVFKGRLNTPRMH